MEQLCTDDDGTVAIGIAKIYNKNAFNFWERNQFL